MRFVIFVLVIIASGSVAVSGPPQQTGVITGHVRDANGAAASKIRVALTEPGQATIVLMQITETDRDGAYRIADIPPGLYNLVAGAADSPTYYPGTAKAADAKAVSVRTGSVTEGIDFTVVTPTVSQNSDSQMQAEIALMRAQLERYRAVSIRSIPPPPGEGWISGHIDFDGVHSWPDRNLAVTVGYTWWNGHGSGTNVGGADGTFLFQIGISPAELPNVEVRFGITGKEGSALPGDYYLESITNGSEDILSKPFKFSGPAVPEIAIKLGTGLHVPGSIRTEDGQAAAKIDIKLVPRLETDRDRLMRTTTTDENGDFAFRGVVPGDYTLAAAPDGQSLPISISAETVSTLNLILTANQILQAARVPSK